MMQNRLPRGNRRGAVIPLMAILLVVLLAIVAFVVDLGYILKTRQEMQKAADSAALAGASQLLLPQFSGTNPNTTAPVAISNAVGEVKKYGAANEAGGVYLTLLDNDLVVGYLADPMRSQEVQPWSSGTPFPNAVRVTARRDSSVNGPLSLFFARAMAIPTWSGQMSATACASRGYNVTGFRSSTLNSLLLPLAINADLWASFLRTGKSADGAVHDDYTVTRASSTHTPPNNVTPTRDNIPEFSDVYPNNNAPGNFGLICLGPPASDTPAFRNWIANGSSPSDLASFGSNGLQATPSAPATVRGGPGLKSTLQSDLQAVVGQSRIVPLFSSCTGQGSNTWYTVVGFAGVSIVKASGHGNNMQVVVQPAVVIDPTATVNGTSWSGSQSFIYPTSPLSLIR